MGNDKKKKVWYPRDVPKENEYFRFKKSAQTGEEKKVGLSQKEKDWLRQFNENEAYVANRDELSVEERQERDHQLYAKRTDLMQLTEELPIHEKGPGDPMDSLPSDRFIAPDVLVEQKQSAVIAARVMAEVNKQRMLAMIKVRKGLHNVSQLKTPKPRSDQ